MPRYFAQADVLLATLRREPIFAYTIPSKLQSYLACGRPVVAALEGEGGRIVKEAGAGWAVAPEDPRALADAVLAAAALSTAEREAMGNRGEAYFREHFEREKLLSRLEQELAMAQTQTMKILILGGDGMLGHQLLKLLRERHEVKVTLRQDLHGLRRRAPVFPGQRLLRASMCAPRTGYLPCSPASIRKRWSTRSVS